jgi:hypothetical protein
MFSTRDINASYEFGMKNNMQNLFGGYGSPLDEELRSGRVSRTRERQELQARTFQGAPMVGRGVTDPEVESKLVQGPLRQSRRSCNNEFVVDSFPPIVNCLTPVMSTKFLAGESTRDIDSQKTFLENSGYENRKGIWTKRTCAAAANH